MGKRFVIDTSVLLYDPDCLERFEDNEVIIPSVVLEEVNTFKEEMTDRGFYARKVAQKLEDISLAGHMKSGVRYGDTVIRTSYEAEHPDISSVFDRKKNDIKIIACALCNEAILVSRDRMMRIMARDFVLVEDYKADMIESQELFLGYRRVIVPGSVVNSLFGGRLNDEWSLAPNEFIIFANETNPQHVAVGIKKGFGIIPCFFDEMDLRGMRTRPLNLEQKMFIWLLLDEDVKCVTATGVSGKGKSLLAIDYALAQVHKNRFNNLMYTKSVIPVDSREELGFYKGSIEEKLRPHLQPLYSSIEYLYQDELYGNGHRISLDELLDGMAERNEIAPYPLANIRGMSVMNKVIILDEAQNTTNHMMKSLVTRVGANSKLIVIGDVEQIDDKNLNRYNNGLAHLAEAGRDEAYIGHITMDIDPRSKRGLLAEFGSHKL